MKYINTKDLSNHWPIYCRTDEIRRFNELDWVFCPIVQERRVIPYFTTFEEYRAYVQGDHKIGKDSRHIEIEKECEVMYVICLRPAYKDNPLFKLWRKEEAVEGDGDRFFVCYGCTSDLAVAQQIAEYNYSNNLITKFYPFETQRDAYEQRCNSYSEKDKPLYRKFWTYPDDNQNPEKQG